jgi:hypothetical protein
VCFGSIENRRGCLINTHPFSTSLSTPIQMYAFTMLRNVGYLVEQKIFMEKDFLLRLLNLAASGSEPDDKFYGLCLYLFRRATEYHFLKVSSGLVFFLFHIGLFFKARRRINQRRERIRESNGTMSNVGRRNGYNSIAAQTKVSCIHLFFLIKLKLK